MKREITKEARKFDESETHMWMLNNEPTPAKEDTWKLNRANWIVDELELTKTNRNWQNRIYNRK